MDMRKNKRDRLAQEAKEFQRKQMQDKEAVEDSNKKQEQDAHEKERKRLTKFDEEARISMRKQKEKLQANQDSLL